MNQATIDEQAEGYAFLIRDAFKETARANGRKVSPGLLRPVLEARCRASGVTLSPDIWEMALLFGSMVKAVQVARTVSKSSGQQVAEGTA